MKKKNHPTLLPQRAKGDDVSVIAAPIIIPHYLILDYVMWYYVYGQVKI